MERVFDNFLLFSMVKFTKKFKGQKKYCYNNFVFFSLTEKIKNYLCNHSFFSLLTYLFDYENTIHIFRINLLY